VTVQQLHLLGTAPAAFESLDMAAGNELLVAWGHRLGVLNRPFSQRCYALFVDGEPVSLAMSAAPVGTPVQAEPDEIDPDGKVVRRGERLRRQEVVELARLCSAPGQAWASRVMIRVWREVFARRWPDGPVSAAVSYSQNAHHRGDLYRFDGWTKVRERTGNQPGRNCTWTRSRAADHPARGLKSLWVWRYSS
jgi:hypothetical protein